MVKSGAFAETDVWGNPKEEEYEVHYPHEPPKGCMWIVDGLPKPSPNAPGVAAPGSPARAEIGGPSPSTLLLPPLLLLTIPS